MALFLRMVTIVTVVILSHRRDSPNASSIGKIPTMARNRHGYDSGLQAHSIDFREKNIGLPMMDWTDNRSRRAKLFAGKLRAPSDFDSRTPSVPRRVRYN
jgi:hypothetical protein